MIVDTGIETNENKITDLNTNIIVFKYLTSDGKNSAT